MIRPIPLLVVLLVCGCNSSGPPVDMIVPNDFAGPIRIVLDESAPDLPLVNGRYRVTVPSSGVLRIRSFVAFERWHTFTASYEDGSPIPQPIHGTLLDPNAIALRGGHCGVIHKDGRDFPEIEYFVGTEQETHDFLVNKTVPSKQK